MVPGEKGLHPYPREIQRELLFYFYYSALSIFGTVSTFGRCFKKVQGMNEGRLIQKQGRHWHGTLKQCESCVFS